MPKITMTDAADERVKTSILNPLVRFNEMRSGTPTNYRPLAIVLSDPTTGEIVGGLWGETYFSYLYIDMFLFRNRCAERVWGEG